MAMAQGTGHPTQGPHCSSPFWHWGASEVTQVEAHHLLPAFDPHLHPEQGPLHIPAHCGTCFSDPGKVPSWCTFSVCHRAVDIKNESHSS